MNLTALFNMNYFKQNIKKSRALILLCVVVMPIINALILLLINNSTHNINFISSTMPINAVNFLGMYVIPEVIAICLYNYVFNKKSVDFIGSMPINRKTVYFTNLIGGIVLIVIMQALIAISTLILMPFLGSMFIVPKLILSNFLRYTLYYIFVYTTCVLAISLSGNIFVQVVITLLITFFVPFLLDTFYIIRVENVGLYSNVSLAVETNIVGIDELNDKIVATAPYYFIKMMLNDEGYYNYSLSNIIMIGLSTIYAILAGYFFFKKKMEHAEEGITNEKAHVFVKALTLLPFFAFYEVVLKENIIGSAVFFTALLVYSIVYDIITRRKISIKLQIVSFIIIVAIYLGTFGIYTKIAEERETYTYHKSDIASINIVLTNHDGYDNYLRYNEVLDSNQLKYEITDKDIINHMVTLINGDYYDNYSSYSDEFYYGTQQQIAVKLNFKDGRTAMDNVYVRGVALEETIEKLSKDSGFYEAMRNDMLLENNDSTEVVFDFYKADKEIKQEVLDNYNNTIPNTLKEFYDYNRQMSDDENTNSVGYIYKYKNNEIKRYTVFIGKNNELSEKIADYINSQTIKKLAREQAKYSGYKNVSISQLSRSIARDMKDYDQALIAAKYQEIRYAQNSMLGDDLLNFILNNEEEFDINQKYYTLVFSIGDYGRGTYYTNNIEGINKIIENRFNIIVDINELKPVYDEAGKIVLSDHNYIVFEDEEDDEEEYYYKK